MHIVSFCFRLLVTDTTIVCLLLTLDLLASSPKLSYLPISHPVLPNVVAMIADARQKARYEVVAEA